MLHMKKKKITIDQLVSSCWLALVHREGNQSVLRPSLVAANEGGKRVEHKCTQIVDVRCVARALTCLEIHPFFSLLSLSLFLRCTGWSARVAEGRKGGCTSLERVNTAHRSGTHKYTVSQRESGTKSIARTYAVVYACTRTHPPHPEDTGTGGGGGGKGEAFNFSCCLHDQPEAEILAEEYAAVHGA